MSKIKENICSYHGDIILLAKKIQKTNGINSTNEINECVKEIIKLAKLAKTAGIHMENRLQIYRNGMENMGFVRKKRKKYTIKEGKI